tara:strand:+ start:4 stop:174 length:171 start_codon:yes stop_codon:yes gene_type:complete
MSWLDWNSIENSRHGIAVSKKVQSKTIPLLLSELECTSNEGGLLSQDSHHCYTVGI